MKSVISAHYKWCHGCGAAILLAADYCYVCRKTTVFSELPVVKGSEFTRFLALLGCWRWLGSGFLSLVSRLPQSQMKSLLDESIGEIEADAFLRSGLPNTEVVSMDQPNESTCKLIRLLVLALAEGGIEWTRAVDNRRLAAVGVTVEAIEQELDLLRAEQLCQLACDYCAESRAQSDQSCRFCESDFAAPPEPMVIAAIDFDSLNELLLCVASFRRSRNEYLGDVITALTELGVTKSDAVWRAQSAETGDTLVPLSSWEITLQSVGLIFQLGLRRDVAVLVARETEARIAGKTITARTLRQYAFDVVASGAPGAERADAEKDIDKLRKLEEAMHRPKTDWQDLCFSPESQVGPSDAWVEQSMRIESIMGSARSVFSDAVSGSANREDTRQKANIFMGELNDFLKDLVQQAIDSNDGPESPALASVLCGLNGLVELNSANL